MGYGTLERDSLITLKCALELAMKKLGTSSQRYKDMNYELSRIMREM